MRMIWSGHVARMNDTRNACKIWVGKPVRPRHRWEDNIRMDLKETVGECELYLSVSG
jgi:hypothetical protein